MDEQEQAAPVDWQAIARQRERELKTVGERKHAAEQQLATAREALASASLRAARMGHATKQAAELAVRLEDAEAGITAAIRQRKAAEERARKAEAALDRVRALRDDLRGVTGARYIADALDNILDPPAPDPDTTGPGVAEHFEAEHAEQVADAWNTLQTMVNRVREATAVDTAHRYCILCGSRYQPGHTCNRVAMSRVYRSLTDRAETAEQQRDQYARLLRDILYASHNITGQDWARWRETLDTITDQEQP